MEKTFEEIVAFFSQEPEVLGNLVQEDFMPYLDTFAKLTDTAIETLKAREVDTHWIVKLATSVIPVVATNLQAELEAGNMDVFPELLMLQQVGRTMLFERFVTLAMLLGIGLTIESELC